MNQETILSAKEGEGESAKYKKITLREGLASTFKLGKDGKSEKYNEFLDMKRYDVNAVLRIESFMLKKFLSALEESRR